MCKIEHKWRVSLNDAYHTHRHQVDVQSKVYQREDEITKLLADIELVFVTKYESMYFSR